MAMAMAMALAMAMANLSCTPPPTLTYESGFVGSNTNRRNYEDKTL